jgi:hypothetical protein
MAAVLASKVVANINVFSAESHGAESAWANIMFQSDDGGDLKTASDTTNKETVMLNNFDFVLEPEDQGFLPRDDLHWLVSRIEQQ